VRASALGSRLPARICAKPSSNSVRRNSEFARWPCRTDFRTGRDTGAALATGDFRPERLRLIGQLVLVLPTAFWRQPSPQPSPAICGPSIPDALRAGEGAKQGSILFDTGGLGRVRSPSARTRTTAFGLGDLGLPRWALLPRYRSAARLAPSLSLRTSGLPPLAFFLPNRSAAAVAPQLLPPPHHAAPYRRSRTGACQGI